MDAWLMSNSKGKLFQGEDSKWFYDSQEEAIEVFKQSDQEMATLTPEGAIAATHVLRRDQSGDVLIENLGQS